jgi:hypothetical protein
LPLLNHSLRLSIASDPINNFQTFRLTGWHQDNMMTKSIEHVQTGVRIEKRILKVLKALAEQLDISLGDLLEGMALHCFEDKPPFPEETLRKIDPLKQVYDLGLTAADSHKLNESGDPS